MSQYLKTLGHTVKKIGDEYAKSEDVMLKQLEDDYLTMRHETNHLSELVEQGLSEYDRVISGASEAIVGIGMSISDPEMISNGGFENGGSYWTFLGSADHTVTSEESYSGSNSALLGFKNYTPIANDFEGAYQLLTIPDNSINLHLSLAYKLYTYDSSTYDRLEVYVAQYGEDPQLFFSIGGQTAPGLEVYGWSTWSTDLSSYGYTGQIYVYVAVYNGEDTAYQTYAYIDDVSLTYDTVQSCDWQSWLQCAAEDWSIAAICGSLLLGCEIFPFPVNPFCWASLICAATISIYCVLEYCVF